MKVKVTIELPDGRSESQEMDEDVIIEDYGSLSDAMWGILWEAKRKAKGEKKEA